MEHLHLEIAPGAKVGKGHILLQRQAGGPVGSRWQVRSPDAQVRLADIVAAGPSESLRALCKNAEAIGDYCDSDHVVRVLEHGWLSGEVYYQVLDLAPDAQPLHEAYSLRKLTCKEALDLASQIVEGLLHLHRREMALGALALQSIYIQAGVIRLGELWFCHNADGIPYHRELQGILSWPLHYLPTLAPELLQGETPRRESDIFSLGAMLFHLLAGEYPRDVEPQTEPMSYRQALAAATCRDLDSLRADLDGPIVGFIGKMLSTQKGERPITPMVETILNYLRGVPNPRFLAVD